MAKEDLGLIRTHLANERTLLAYVRTALAFLAAGAGLIHFFPARSSAVIGGGLVALGAFVLAVGAARFVQVRRLVNRAEESRS